MTQHQEVNLKIRISVISALIISFCLLTVLMFNDSITAFENYVYSSLTDYMYPTITKVMIIITNIGSLWMISIIAVMLLVLPYTRMRLGVPIAVNVCLSTGLNNILKMLIARDRPDILRLVAETGYGFPSGHAMINATLYMIIILIVFRLTKSQKIRIPILAGGAIIVFLIGVSRIYLGVHNAGDILAGWIMGVTIALITDTLWRCSRRRITPG